MRTPIAADLHFRRSASPPLTRVIMQDKSGYSNLFYIMLVLGIVGLIGFLVIAVGAGAGGFSP